MTKLWLEGGTSRDYGCSLCSAILMVGGLRLSASQHAGCSSTGDQVTLDSLLTIELQANRRRSADISDQSREESRQDAKIRLVPVGLFWTGSRPTIIWKMTGLAGKSLWIRGWEFIHNVDSRALDGDLAVTQYSLDSTRVCPTFPSSLDDTVPNPGRQHSKQTDDVHRSFHRCGCFCGQTASGGVARN
jgi:hypothetical protein